MSLHKQKEDSQRRDLHPSRRHRAYPDGFYAYDVDFIEYDENQQPVGYFEYKHSGEEVIDLQSHQMICHRNTANRLKIPFFVVQYWYLDSKGRIMHAESKEEIVEAGFYLIPANEEAKCWLSAQEMSERQFVQLLGRLRGEEIAATEYSNEKLGYQTHKIRNAI